MSADIVNLRQARKAKARADQQTTAKQNRAKYGRTKAERARDSQRETRSNTDLDGKKRED